MFKKARAVIQDAQKEIDRNRRTDKVAEKREQKRQETGK